ncbi:response regulator transcription factor [Paenibacillus sp. GCM10027629]|uniref:response regulator transcription factor n=1 Tax=Paenibacillus sp. GCM10027629 TaxID=3273414 RepID=UPI00363F25DA
MTNIMIVDDDAHIRELVCLFLRQEGFQTCEATNGLEALDLIERTKVDMMILDIMMPKMDGWELCRELRRHYDLPLLMLTAKGETTQKLKGFELGTDDYLVKPFDPLELVARVKVLLKRYQITASRVVTLGKMQLNHNTLEVTNGLGEATTLPPKEFELLFKLGSYPEKTFTREQLIQDIWGYDFEGNERTLDVHMNRLRDRFPQAAYGFRIRTVRGIGYRLEIEAES